MAKAKILVQISEYNNFIIEMYGYIHKHKCITLLVILPFHLEVPVSFYINTECHSFIIIRRFIYTFITALVIWKSYILWDVCVCVCVCLGVSVCLPVCVWGGVRGCICVYLHQHLNNGLPNVGMYGNNINIAIQHLLWRDMF